EEVDADVVSSALLDGGHGLGVDLAGADLYNVAYASVTVSETIATCVGVYDRANTCSEWGYDVVEETIELGFDEMGAVWGGDLGLTHTGTIELRTMLYGQEGRRVSQMRQKLRSPWEDGSSGDNALSLDEDPQTGLGFTTVDGVPWLTVVSDGWTEGAALPVDAKVELSTGETLVIPVESYQRKATPVAPTTSDARELYDLIDSSSFRVNLGGQPLAVADAIRGSEGSSCSAATGDGTPRTDLSLADFDGGPVCMQGTCVSFVGDGAGGYAMSVTQYRWDDNFVGGETNAVITRLDRSGAAVAERAFAFTYTDEITAVFSVEVGFAGDPTNLGLAGKVSLRGQADRRGKQSTLAKGSFYGAVTRDGDGDISLGGADKDALLVALEPSFAVLFSGSPSSCGDDETGYSGQWPKVVSMRGWPDRPPRDETTCKKVALCCRD
ncbi:MAG TPA: hypothetical protein PKW90_10850, partial [Myxococcota bacterium]|nr:hypothetical protein [Myxococcota bacterium]